MESEKNRKISAFTDLIAWQKGHEFVIGIYRITKSFPSDERFGLTNQMRRAAVSVTSNISEGFGRKPQKEKLQFFYYSSGSLTELKNQLLIAKDIGYIGSDETNKLLGLADETHKLLYGLIKKVRGD